MILKVFSNLYDSVIPPALVNTGNGTAQQMLKRELRKIPCTVKRYQVFKICYAADTGIIVAKQPNLSTGSTSSSRACGCAYLGRVGNTVPSASGWGGGSIPGAFAAERCCLGTSAPRTSPGSDPFHLHVREESAERQRRPGEEAVGEAG
ncbi:hypothetical protein QYF61_006824 [Mycteria americana]|uniref:Uncharacterized protein n=1 Tax=Mycteria americana TaxID=33587 RepID=A0AAN7MLJ2_MYCAM|nr:hypothetical protein QYF61_006824 [Mycteria americana]